MSVESNSLPTGAPAPHAPTALELVRFLEMAVGQRASDIHLRIGLPPTLRKDGVMVPTKLPALSREDLGAFLRQVTPPMVASKLKTQTDVDFGFELPGIARFRASFFYQAGQPALVLRVIPQRIPTITDLGIPPVVTRFAELHKGLVLVTGPTGSGKSTTLAALIHHINQTSRKHIVTLEDPVEFIHAGIQSIVTQRQLGTDTNTFPNGLKHALRQDPDVILIGEIRDRETLISALHAAETGHLVLSTLHTTDTVQTLNRIINVFDPHEREPIRRQVANVLQGVISQRLLPHTDNASRVAVAEIMTMTATVRDYILRDELDEIYPLLDNSHYDIMTSLNNALYKAVRNQQVSREDALKASEKPAALENLFQGAYHGNA